MPKKTKRTLNSEENLGDVTFIAVEEKPKNESSNKSRRMEDTSEDDGIGEVASENDLKSETICDSKSVIRENSNNLETKQSISRDQSIVSKKAKKLLPAGYVCNGCGAVENHAIYDCPKKISKKKRETPNSENSNSSNVDLSEGSSSRKREAKLVLSGLPFTSTNSTVIDFISDKVPDIYLKPSDVKLLMFEDNPKKCKGMAFITLSAAQRQFEEKILSLTGEKVNDRGHVLKVEREVTNFNKDVSSHSKKEKDNIITKRCYRCGEKHDPATCKNPRICYRCKATDHLSSNCPKRNSAK
jgi:hypothetical protein